MKQITFSVQKSAVMVEIAKTTAYIGAKTPDASGNNSYDRVFTTNDDEVMLDRFFREAKSVVSDILKRYLTSYTDQGNDNNMNPNEQFSLVLSVTDRFDQSLIPAINGLIFSFFVNHITYKWFAITNRADMQYYATESIANLKDIQTKLFFKSKPNQNIRK